MPLSPAVHVLDLLHLGRPHLIASFLVLGPRGLGDGAVLVETGPGVTYERLKEAMQEVGARPVDIRDVVLTHIHLDHAGAAGHLAAEPLFEGRIHVHEAGAPHLVDPSRLIESAKRIYKSDMDRLWGELRPVPAERVVALQDGDVIEAGDLRFTAMYTPGHAQHHCCFRLKTPGRPICFTGDAAGMIVPNIRPPKSGDGSPFINLPTPPPEFDLELWMESVDRIEAERFRSLYLTHFGEVKTPELHLVAVRRSLRAHAEFIRSAIAAQRRGEQEESAIFDQYQRWVRRQARGAGLSAEQTDVFVSENLLRMNIVGIERYWRQRGD